MDDYDIYYEVVTITRGVDDCQWFYNLSDAMKVFDAAKEYRDYCEVREIKENANDTIIKVIAECT